MNMYSIRSRDLEGLSLLLGRRGGPQPIFESSMRQGTQADRTGLRGSLRARSWSGPLMAMLLMLAVVLPVPGFAATLAHRGLPAATIIVAATATGAEIQAARELAAYLGRISGAAFQICEESRAAAVLGTRVFVGPTLFAADHRLGPDQFGSEEWIVRTVGADLVVTGGRPRGTLYAVYHFLEDVLGVHWWNPFEESVPRHATLRIGSLNLRGAPAIRYRDIYMLYGHDDGRFAVRNRLNREGDAPIAPQYGGSRDYGPPYHVHTFNLYFPPRDYFQDHPEWYSLLDGKRVADGSQLCLTQPDLRRAFLSKLLGYIESSSEAARAAGSPPPVVFSVSQNDCLNPCQCTNCQAIARSEESECGPLLDFVNFLADGIKDRHPSVFLDTLAYQYTQKAPKTLRPRDNVIVRLCDTESDPSRPITDPVNTAFREHLLQWSRIARNLRVWDYAVTYAQPVGMPMPTAWTLGPDYRFFASHNVEGVFTELEFEILADMRDLKVWLMMKQLEDPSADYARLLRTFTDGFYGRAGVPIRRYLEVLRREARARGTHCDWNSTPQSLSYLSLRFIHEAQQLFDRAEQAVGDDPVLLRRVRHARLPLDRATVVLHPRLRSEWLAAASPSRMTPPSRQVTAERVMKTWIEQAKLRFTGAAQELEIQHAEGEMRRYAMVADDLQLPARFRGLPKGSVADYVATMTRNWGDVVKVVKDPDAESGIANKLDLTSAGVESSDKYVLPMPWGIYATAEKKHVGGSSIQVADIPGPGYHWYKMGTFPIRQGYYVYFFWSWIIQTEVDNVVDPEKPDQPFEVWARVKFTGPRFPHAVAGEADAIYVERMVLVKPTP